MNKARINCIYLPEALVHRLREEQAQTGASATELIRRALEAFLPLDPTDRRRRLLAELERIQSTDII